MSNALMRGRTLDRKAVEDAKNWQEKRIKYLLSKDRLSLTPKERNEARRLTGRWDFWEYKETLVADEGLSARVAKDAEIAKRLGIKT